MNHKNILVTGGSGYIGTHTLLALNKAGYSPIVIDNLSNSNHAALQKTETLAGNIKFPFYKSDLRSRSVLEQIFKDHHIHAVIHFAGLKAVGESVTQPLKYYANNLESTLVLLDVMNKSGCHKLVFSSSAAVYGTPQSLPIVEDQSLKATNPYGQTKLFIEQILTDIASEDLRWHIGILRYFNPVGAHPSGKIGEAPLGKPNNLFPCITQFMTGKHSVLEVFGDDYPTHDGTGVRDFLHVCDLAKGHVAALNKIENLKGAMPINLGTGKGYSVLEVVRMFETVSRRRIPFTKSPRRPGDVACCYADVSKAETILEWRAELGLRAMVEDSCRWQNLYHSAS